MKDTPTVSVVMSAFNEEQDVEDAVESILSQSFSNFEFIVVDDASTDGTCSILNSYALSDDRMHVLKNKQNKGLPASLNRAINYSNGKYIARMDADDVACPERLSKQVDYMNKHTDVVVLGTGAHLISGAGERFETYIPPTSHEEIVSALPRFNPFVHSSVLIRREALERVGQYNERFDKAQDYELWVRLLDEGQLASLAEPLMKRRIKRNRRGLWRKKQIYYGILARWRLLSKTDQEISSYLSLIRPILSLIVPEWLKRRL